MKSIPDTLLGRACVIRSLAMRLSRIALSLFSSLSFGGAADAPTFAHHPNSDLAAKAKQIIAKVDGAKPSFVVLGQTPGTLSALIYRARTGEAELHDQMSDFFVVRSGAATLVLGGKMDTPRTVRPGEYAAPKIIGGESRAIGPGDVVYIPAKMPHHVVLGPRQTITYLLIKAKE